MHGDLSRGGLWRSLPHEAATGGTLEKAQWGGENLPVSSPAFCWLGMSWGERVRENWVVMLCQLCLSYDIGEGGLGGVSVCVYVWFRMVSVCFERLSVCVCVCVWFRMVFLGFKRLSVCVCLVQNGICGL